MLWSAAGQTENVLHCGKLSPVAANALSELFSDDVKQNTHLDNVGEGL